MSTVRMSRSGFHPCSRQHRKTACGLRGIFLCTEHVTPNTGKTPPDGYCHTTAMSLWRLLSHLGQPTSPSKAPTSLTDYVQPRQTMEDSKTWKHWWWPLHETSTMKLQHQGIRLKSSALHSLIKWQCVLTITTASAKHSARDPPTARCRVTLPVPHKEKPRAKTVITFCCDQRYN